MKKRFNAKKAKKSKNPLLLFIFIVGFFISFSLVFKNLSINLNEDIIINYILNSGEDELSFEKIISPTYLLNYTFNANVAAEEVFVEEVNESPLVYIYNTHPTEYYADSNFEIFNITPTVVTASYILKEYLEEYGIYSIVESESVTDILYENDWSYSSSYTASRILLENAIEEYSTVEYYIDLHRDAASKETTTVEVNGESCVNYMFVIGAEYEGYESNYSLASKINEGLLNINENFTRGIILKEGEYVDGVYNQDLSENAILIEVGAQYNTIDEVNCGMKYLSEVIASVIKD